MTTENKMEVFKVKKFKFSFSTLKYGDIKVKVQGYFEKKLRIVNYQLSGLKLEEEILFIPVDGSLFDFSSYVIKEKDILSTSSTRLSPEVRELVDKEIKLKKDINKSKEKDYLELKKIKDKFDKLMKKEKEKDEKNKKRLDKSQKRLNKEISKIKKQLVLPQLKEFSEEEAKKLIKKYQQSVYDFEVYSRIFYKNSKDLLEVEISIQYNPIKYPREGDFNGLFFREYDGSASYYDFDQEKEVSIVAGFETGCNWKLKDLQKKYPKYQFELDLNIGDKTVARELRITKEFKLPIKNQKELKKIFDEFDSILSTLRFRP